MQFTIAGGCAAYSLLRNAAGAGVMQHLMQHHNQHHSLEAQLGQGITH